MSEASSRSKAREPAEKPIPMFANGMSLNDLVEGRTTLAKQNGVSDDSLEVLYSLALSQYKQGRFEEAKRSFLLMAVMKHTDARVYLAIGSCFHMMKKYDKAVEYYGVAATLDKDNPEPVWRAAQCLQLMGRTDLARKSLLFLDLLVEDEPKHAALAARSKAMRRRMEGGAS